MKLTTRLSHSNDSENYTFSASTVRPAPEMEGRKAETKLAAHYTLEKGDREEVGRRARALDDDLRHRMTNGCGYRVIGTNETNHARAFYNDGLSQLVEFVSPPLGGLDITATRDGKQEIGDMFDMVAFGQYLMKGE